MWSSLGSLWRQQYPRRLATATPRDQYTLQLIKAAFSAPLSAWQGRLMGKIIAALRG
jgi:hypothetical protein